MKIMDTLLSVGFVLLLWSLSALAIAGAVFLVLPDPHFSPKLTCASALGAERVALHCDEGRP